MGAVQNQPFPEIELIQLRDLQPLEDDVVDYAADERHDDIRELGEQFVANSMPMPEHDDSRLSQQRFQSSGVCGGHRARFDIGRPSKRDLKCGAQIELICGVDGPIEALEVLRRLGTNANDRLGESQIAFASHDLMKPGQQLQNTYQSLPNRRSASVAWNAAARRPMHRYEGPSVDSVRVPDRREILWLQYVAPVCSGLPFLIDFS